MEATEELPSLPFNKQAIISVILGVITLITFCAGMLPIPFTGFICFPLSFILGLVAIIYGIISLNKIKRNNESGKPMAWTGIVLGGIIFLCFFCTILAFVSLFIFSPDTIQPLIENYSI